MNWPALPGYAAQAAAAALAWPLAKRRPFHRPFALLATWLAAEDPARAILDALRPHQPHPYQGTALALWTLDRSSYLSRPLALALACVVAFPGWPPWHAVGASAALLVALALTYPASSAPWVVPVVHAAALALGAVAVGAWARRRRWPTVTQALLTAYLAADLALFAGPYTAPAGPRASWPAAVPLYFGLQVGALIAQWLWLQLTTSPEAPPSDGSSATRPSSSSSSAGAGPG